MVALSENEEITTVILGNGVEMRNGLVHVRADTFYSSVVNAAGGEMIFLGGHGAFDGRFQAYHMHIAMFVAYGHAFYGTRDFRYNTRWGLRYAFISGGAQTTLANILLGPAVSTVGVINSNAYLERADRRFWNHLHSGTGMVQQLFNAHNHFMDNYSRRRAFAYTGRWVNSTSYTIGLVNAVGLNHGLSSEQVARAWGINSAFAPRFFGK